MTRKSKRRSSIVEIGTGPARVRIYTIKRKDGYDQFTLAWKEGGIRRTRCLSSMDEARMIAQQITVRLINRGCVTDEATKRDIELLRHCERAAGELGVTLSAAIDEWTNARRAAGEISLAEAIRFHQANRRDIPVTRTIEQVADEFVESRRARGGGSTYVKNSRLNLKRFTGHVKGNIDEVTVADINGFLQNQKLSPVYLNGIRRSIVGMFAFAKRQGYLHPDRKTAAELSESFRQPDAAISIYTPEEMGGMLLAAKARHLPFLAIGAFAGIRSAEIHRLHWEDIKWDRGHIEIAGCKAKTAARRLVPLPDNLKAWLAPWREQTGLIIQSEDKSGALNELAVASGVPGGWRQNALRHSFISYRVAETGDVPRTALEAGNSPQMIFRHYREVVDGEAAKAWFAITPPDGWLPKDLPMSSPARLRQISLRKEKPCVDSTTGASL
jgi:integrase